MLDLSFIREKYNDLIKSLKLRGWDSDKANNTVAYLRELDANIRTLKDKLNHIQHERNVISADNNMNVEQKQEKVLPLKDKIEEIETELNNLEKSFNKIFYKLPNMLDDNVLEGNSSDDNKIIGEWGNILEIKQRKIIPHYDLIDNTLIEQAVAMSGSRFISVPAKIAELYRALSSYCLDFLKDQNYTELYVPFLISEDALFKSGHMPSFEENLFWLEDKKMALIPTAEASLVNIIQGKLLKKLPIKLCSYTPCFRKEAGAGGRDIKGIIRLHQFHKVEMFIACAAEDSDKYFNEMINTVENILKSLELPYQLELLCSADIGNCASKTIDLKVYRPSTDNYVEISSCSNCTDYQSRRAKIKYINRDNKKEFCHLLNGSCLPIDRLLAVILEIHQYNNEIIVPNVLKKYVSFDKITREDFNDTGF